LNCLPQVLGSKVVTSSRCVSSEPEVYKQSALLGFAIAYQSTDAAAARPREAF
jgi:hypothetical protein